MGGNSVMCTTYEEVEVPRLLDYFFYTIFIFNSQNEYLEKQRVKYILLTDLFYWKFFIGNSPGSIEINI